MLNELIRARLSNNRFRDEPCHCNPVSIRPGWGVHAGGEGGVRLGQRLIDRLPGADMTICVSVLGDHHVLDLPDLPN
jgi:hypothetical protein